MKDCLANTSLSWHQKNDTFVFIRNQKNIGPSVPAQVVWLHFFRALGKCAGIVHDKVGCSRNRMLGYFSELRIGSDKRSMVELYTYIKPRKDTRWNTW